MSHTPNPQDPNAIAAADIADLLSRIRGIAQTYPACAVQVYPGRDGGDWWGGYFLVPTEGVEGSFPTLGNGCYQLDNLLAQTGARARPVSSAEAALITRITADFAAWAARVPDGSTDGGPGFRLTASGAGFVFYDGREDLVTWPSLAEAAARIASLRASAGA